MSLQLREALVARGGEGDVQSISGSDPAAASFADLWVAINRSVTDVISALSRETELPPEPPESFMSKRKRRRKGPTLSPEEEDLD